MVVFLRFFMNGAFDRFERSQLGVTRLDHQACILDRDRNPRPLLPNLGDLAETISQRRKAVVLVENSDLIRRLSVRRPPHGLRTRRSACIRACEAFPLAVLLLLLPPPLRRRHLPHLPPPPVGPLSQPLRDRNRR